MTQVFSRARRYMLTAGRGCNASGRRFAMLCPATGFATMSASGDTSETKCSSSRRRSTERPESALPRRWRACRRRTGIHPTEPFPTGITNGRYGANLAVRSRSRGGSLGSTAAVFEGLLRPRFATRSGRLTIPSVRRKRLTRISRLPLRAAAGGADRGSTATTAGRRG